MTTSAYTRTWKTAALQRPHTESQFTWPNVLQTHSLLQVQRLQWSCDWPHLIRLIRYAYVTTTNSTGLTLSHFRQWTLCDIRSFLAENIDAFASIFASIVTIRGC